MTKILDGKIVKERILSELTSEIADLKKRTGKVPGLAVILVGENPASQSYVRMKERACEQIGIRSFEHLVAAEQGEDHLCELIETLNNDSRVDGILLQLPLPKGYDEQKILGLILPEKDVDGFHPVNLGRLMLGLPTIKSRTIRAIFTEVAQDSSFFSRLCCSSGGL